MTDRERDLQNLLCRSLYWLHGVPEAAALCREIEAQIGTAPEARLGWTWEKAKA